jgi:hypothetical protein
MESEVQRYYVSWGEEITASSPEDAARRALAMQRDPEAVSSARVFRVHAGARDLSVEVSASGATAHVRWDSAEQVGSDGMYTAEFWAMPPERQLQWRVSDYLSEQLSGVDVPHPEGWRARGLDDADDFGAGDDLSGPVGFLVRTTGPAFKVTVELCGETAPADSDVTGK